MNPRNFTDADLDALVERLVPRLAKALRPLMAEGLDHEDEAPPPSVPTRAAKDAHAGQSRFIPIRKAAVKVHRDRSVVRNLVERGLVAAIRCGGSDAHPRLRVDPDEIERVMAAVDAHAPKALPSPPRQRHPRPPLPSDPHPAVVAILARLRSTPPPSAR